MQEGPHFAENDQAILSAVPAAANDVNGAHRKYCAPVSDGE
jgi:hypothetical protein